MRKKERGPMQVKFICPKCDRQLVWALPSAVMKCPGCGKWVTDDNRKKECDVFLPVDSDQTVLF